MIVGIIVSIAGLGVACMGMKCTTCGGNDKLRKSRIAMTGGIILLVGGEDRNAPLGISQHFPVVFNTMNSDDEQKHYNDFLMCIPRKLVFFKLRETKYKC